jgi:hypothetical protein
MRTTTAGTHRTCVWAATFVLLMSSAPWSRGQSSVESLLAEREAEMGRSVDARLRPAVLERMAARGTTSAIGDTDADLVFTPLAPCRIIDTRVPTSGILSVGVPRAFVVAGDSSVFQLQGGQAGGCGVPLGATAAMLNLVATRSVGPGFLKATPWAAGPPAMPNASVINYGLVSGLAAIANGLALPVCDPAVATCTYDLYVESGVNDTHFVVDVVGYYGRVAGMLKGAQAPLAVSGTNVGLSSVGCAAGYVWKWNGSTWACQADANTTYSASSPVSLSGTTFGLSAAGCASGYVWKYNGSTWACSPDNNTTYGAGTGLDLSGTTFSVDTTDVMRVPSYWWYTSTYALSNDGSWQTIASSSTNAPVAGRILAIATVMVSCGSAAIDGFNHVLTTSSTGTDGFYGVTGCSNGHYDSVTTIGYFDVVGPGTTTVYWRANHNTAVWMYAYYPRITLIFIPS